MDRNAQLDHALNNAVEAQNLYNLSAIQGTPGVYASTPTPQQAQMNDLVDAITKNRQQPKQPSEPTQPKFNFDLGPQAKVLAEWANSDDPELQNKALKYFVKAFPNDEARKDFYHTVAANYGPKNKRLSVNPYIADKGAKILNNASMMLDNEEGKLDLGTKESGDVYGGQSGGLDRQDYGKKVPTSSTKYERLLGVTDADGTYQNQYDMIHTDDIDNYLSDYEKTVNKIKSNEIPSEDDEDSPFLSAEEKAETQMENAGENPFQKKALRKFVGPDMAPDDKYLRIGNHFGTLTGKAMVDAENKDIADYNLGIDARKDSMHNKFNELELQRIEKELNPYLGMPTKIEDNLEFIEGMLDPEIEQQIRDYEAQQKALAKQYNIGTAKGQEEYNLARAKMEKLQKDKMALVNYKGGKENSDITGFNDTSEGKWYGTTGSNQELFDKMRANVMKGKKYNYDTGRVFNGNKGLSYGYSQDKGTRALGQAMQENAAIMNGYIKAERDGKVVLPNELKNLAIASRESGNMNRAKRYISLYRAALNRGVIKIFSLTDPTRPNEKVWFGFTRDNKFVNITPEGADVAAVSAAPEAVEAGAQQTGM